MQFNAVVKEATGIEAEITTAIKLPQEIEKEIVSILQSQFGQKVKLNKKVNQEIIGGLYLRVGDQVVDMRLSTKLEKIRERLYQ